MTYRAPRPDRRSADRDRVDDRGSVSSGELPLAVRKLHCAVYTRKSSEGSIWSSTRWMPSGRAARPI
jgi:hypothetical protein